VFNFVHEVHSGSSDSDASVCKFQIVMSDGNGNEGEGDKNGDNKNDSKGRSGNSGGSPFKARLEEFKGLLNKDHIDSKHLRKLAFHGIPEETNLRPLCWRILLNYLPSDKSTWESVLEKKRNLYFQFVDEILTKCSEGDHPLNPDPESSWQAFFKDNEVLLQIDKDVRRLCPEMSFFQSATTYPNHFVKEKKIDRLTTRVSNASLNSAVVERKGLGITKISNSRVTEMMSPLSDSEEAHWEVVERILFIYAKLNPGQSYVQGMNEIIGPIYYTLATDPNLQWREFAEPDTFHLFTNLMGEIRDFFIRTLDNSSSGIQRMMMELMERVKVRDNPVYEKLISQEIHPQYFCFRWITLMLSQEFQLPEVLRIWDSLLADDNRFDFLIDVSSAMIIHLRSELLVGDFSTNMKLLQNFPSVDVREILQLAITQMT